MEIVKEKKKEPWRKFSDEVEYVSQHMDWLSQVGKHWVREMVESLYG